MVVMSPCFLLPNVYKCTCIQVYRCVQETWQLWHSIGNVKTFFISFKKMNLFLRQLKLPCSLEPALPIFFSTILFTSALCEISQRSSNIPIRAELLFAPIHRMHFIVLRKGLLHRCLEI